MFSLKLKSFIFKFNKYHQPLIKKGNGIFKDYRELFYPNGKKIVTREILDKLDPLGLAVWYLDDGSYDYSHKRLNIATNGFTLIENKIIHQYFKEKWNIDCKIQKAKTHYYIRFNKEYTNKFIELIKTHIMQIPSMTYKIGLDEDRKILAKTKQENYSKINKSLRHNYYLKNRERYRDWEKEYYQQNKEEILFKQKEYYLKNQDRRREYQRNYYNINQNNFGGIQNE